MPPSHRAPESNFFSHPSLTGSPPPLPLTTLLPLSRSRFPPHTKQLACHRVPIGPATTPRSIGPTGTSHPGHAVLVPSPTIDTPPPTLCVPVRRGTRGCMGGDVNTSATLIFPGIGSAGTLKPLSLSSFAPIPNPAPSREVRLRPRILVPLIVSAPSSAAFLTPASEAATDAGGVIGSTLPRLLEAELPSEGDDMSSGVGGSAFSTSDVDGKHNDAGSRVGLALSGPLFARKFPPMGSGSGGAETGTLVVVDEAGDIALYGE